MTEETGTKPKQQPSQPANQLTTNLSLKAAKKVGKRTEHKGKKAKRTRTVKEKKASRAARRAKRLERKARRQKLWRWRFVRFVFHLLWLPVALAGALALGLLIGYSILGGEPAAEVFSRDVWQHLYDIIYANG